MSVSKPTDGHFVYPSSCLLYLFLFNTFIDLSRGLLVRPEKTDDACFLRIQDVPILISNNKVQLQDPDAHNRRVKGSNGVQTRMKRWRDVTKKRQVRQKLDVGEKMFKET